MTTANAWQIHTYLYRCGYKEYALGAMIKLDTASEERSAIAKQNVDGSLGRAREQPSPNREPE
jgi:hypothetical protein